MKRFTATLFLSLVVFHQGVAADTAEAIFEATGVKGGFAIHVGSGDGKLTAGLRANDSYQVQGLDGDRGALLWAVSTRDGARLVEYELDVPPAFDTLIAAGGGLYWTTMDGHVVCWK